MVGPAITLPHSLDVSGDRNLKYERAAFGQSWLLQLAAAFSGYFSRLKSPRLSRSRAAHFQVRTLGLIIRCAIEPSLVRPRANDKQCEKFIFLHRAFHPGHLNAIWTCQPGAAANGRGKKHIGNRSSRWANRTLGESWSVAEAWVEHS